MITEASSRSHCQRWRDRMATFRPGAEFIRPEQYGVEPIERSTAKTFVVRHHYSGSFVYAIDSYGLFRKDSCFTRSQLVGVATFSTPSNPHSVDRWAGLPSDQGAELGRFVLLDQVEGNGETFFLARALRRFKAQHPEKEIVLSYSDPVPRTTATGQTVFPGHIGTVYAASNAIYAGRGAVKTLFLSTDGRAVANRIFAKIRNSEKGADYSIRTLTELTGLIPFVDESPREFVSRVQDSLRQFRHPGNHLYLFPIGKYRGAKATRISEVMRSRIVEPLPYPKAVDVVTPAAA